MASFYFEARPAYVGETGGYEIDLTLTGSGSISGWTFSAAMKNPDGTAATGTPTAVVADATLRTVTLTLPAQATAGEYFWSVRRTDDSSDDVIAHGTIEIRDPHL